MPELASSPRLTAQIVRDWHSEYDSRAKGSPELAARCIARMNQTVGDGSRVGWPLRRYLTRLCTDTCASFCLSEPSSGSDAFAMKTRAIRDDGAGQWRITGSKCWISNAKEAGLYVVFANADPDKGHKGITAFVVERDNPGLTVGRKEDKLVIRASSTCELLLDECCVPDSAVLGSVGEGYKMAIDLLNEGRIGIGAQMVGLARGAFDAALPHHPTNNLGDTGL